MNMVAFALPEVGDLPAMKENEPMLKYENAVSKSSDGFDQTIEIVYREGSVAMHPAILMYGTVAPDRIPEWGIDLVEQGYMLVAFQVHRPQDPDPARRPQWLFFDQRFAHSYVRMGHDAPCDARGVFDYLEARGDVAMDKIGWIGSSSTGIPGLAVATQGPRLAALVAFVSTGAYQEWIETWKPNGLWKGETDDLWPETVEMLQYDPIRHVEGMYPTAVLMVSGGADAIVDPATARSFVRAAAPYYSEDPERLRLVIYEDMGHNLPRDIIKMYVENWFRLYMSPDEPQPDMDGRAQTLDEEVVRTQITGADHQKLIQGE